MMIYRLDRQTDDRAEVTVLGAVTDPYALATGEHAGLEGLTTITKTVITLGKASREVALQEQVEQLTQERDEYAARLVSPPVQGEAWDAAKRYIRGDEVTHGGIAYISQRFNRGKQPDNHTDAWLPKPVALVITRWEDDPSAFQYQVDDLRSFDLDGDPVQRSNWRCKKAHTKSNIRKPMTVSDFWESYIAQGGITTWNPRRIL